jgi:hypothetical protein
MIQTFNFTDNLYLILAVIFRDLQDHVRNSSHEHLAMAMERLTAAQRLAADRQTDVNRLQMQLNQRR